MREAVGMPCVGPPLPGLQQLLDLLQPCGGPWMACGETFDGVMVAAELDDGEHSRRKSIGLGGVADRNMIRAISALPEHEAVAIADLAPRERRVLERLPVGVVELVAEGVVRLARSPVTSAFAFVAADDVREGANFLAALPPVLGRVIVIRESATTADTLLEAGFYGFGVVSSSEQGHDLLVAPQMPRSKGPVRWTFEEEIYKSLVGSG